MDITMVNLDSLPYFDYMSSAFRDNPYAVLADFRKRGWLARSDRGFEVFTYEKCDQVLRDARWLHGIVDTIANLGGREALVRSPGRNLLTSEGDVHAALRRAVQPWFTPRRADQLRAATRALILELLDPFTEAGGGDFLRDIAARIPPVVFCWMIGAPDSDAPQIAQWSETGLKVFRGDAALLPEINAALGALHGYVHNLIEVKRRAPGDDLISYLIRAVDEGIIGETDMMSVAFEMLAASSDNTSQSATLLAWLMCRFPDQWRVLKGDRSHVPGAVEECMRYEPRIRYSKKLSVVDTELDGVPFPKGTRLFLHVMAAHRDPAVYADPDKFDVTRPHPRPQLNFGLGRHMCLGATLARMEQQEVLRALLDRWDDLMLDGPPDIAIDDGIQVSRLPLAVRPN